MAFSHKLPGEYIFDGMVLGSIHPKHLIEKVPDVDMSGDLLVATYPKTGTTWMQELIWLTCNDGDFATAKKIPLDDRFPFIELSQRDDTKFYDLIQTQPHPRLIKSHLPHQFFRKQLKGNTKVIITVRNPKDTLVSLFHFYRMNSLLGNFTGSWDDYFEMVKGNHMYYGDIFDWYMAWWEKEKENPNVLFVKYEDMKKDLRKVAHCVMQFLGKSLSEKTIDDILVHLNFSNMKKNVMANHSDSPVLKQEISPFMRKGQVGDWKNYFSKEQSEYIDSRYNSTLYKAGLKLDFE